MLRRKYGHPTLDRKSQGHERQTCCFSGRLLRDRRYEGCSQCERSKFIWLPCGLVGIYFGDQHISFLAVLPSNEAPQLLGVTIGFASLYVEKLDLSLFCFPCVVCRCERRRSLVNMANSRWCHFSFPTANFRDCPNIGGEPMGVEVATKNPYPPSYQLQTLNGARTLQKAKQEISAKRMRFRDSGIVQHQATSFQMQQISAKELASSFSFLRVPLRPCH